MTHGDKAKAKASQSSKASGQKAGSKSGGENGKSKAAREGSESKSSSAAQKGGSEKAAAGSQKSSSAKAAVAPRAEADKTDKTDKGKGRGASSGDVSFANPAIGAAFRHAVKKFPNAFRKLTD
ncbi:MAG: hypothetical protein ACLGH0_02285 [Thermoanaerobaculia bacterium]